jgi:hypothetical protein
MIKLNKFEIVQINNNDPSIKDLHNEEAVVFQESIVNPDFYEVYIGDYCYDIHYKCLVSTGRFKPHDKPKFKLYEIVMVITSDPVYKSIINAEAAILSISQYYNGDIWYQIDLDDIEDPKQYLGIEEKNLVSTGKFAKYADYYDGSHVMVSQNGDLKDGNFTS